MAPTMHAHGSCQAGSEAFEAVASIDQEIQHRPMCGFCGYGNAAAYLPATLAKRTSWISLFFVLSTMVWSTMVWSIDGD
jgi:hypothetical protein